jgi:hypothetical protein
MPLSGATVSASSCLRLPASDCELKFYSPLDLYWLDCFDSLDVASAWTYSEHWFPQFLFCCIMSLLAQTHREHPSHPIDGCLFWSNYSGFQQTCHNILSAFCFNHNEIYIYIITQQSYKCSIFSIIFLTYIKNHHESLKLVCILYATIFNQLFLPSMFYKILLIKTVSAAHLLNGPGSQRVASCQ